MKQRIMILILVIIMSMPGVSYALDVGEKAPGFEAPSTFGNIILSDFKGKANVVLAIYYADFTPV